MNTLDPNILVEVATKVAAIDERTKSSEKQADHRHRGIMQAIENFVPRREIETENARLRQYAEQLAQESRDHCDLNREAVLARVGTVEESISEIRSIAKRLNAWGWGVVVTGVGMGLIWLVPHAFRAMSLAGWFK